MASIKEIRTHIKSVEQTLKITNAMYLISSSNLRKARRQLTDVEPYFSKIEATISDILHHSPEIDHRFFDKRPGIPPDKRKTGFIVITGDKGLAGAYNHNILKLAEEKMSRAANSSRSSSQVWPLFTAFFITVQLSLRLSPTMGFNWSMVTSGFFFLANSKR